MHLNWFDFVIIGVIILSVLVSFFRGFLRETISLVSWIAGVVIALRFSQQASSWFESFVSSPTLRYIFAFIALFIAVLIVGMLVGFVVKKGIDASGFSIADRMLGAIFGFARGVLLIAIVLIFVTMTQFKNTDAIVHSELTSTFMPLVTWLNSIFPKQIDQVKQWITSNDRLKSEPPENLQPPDQIQQQPAVDQAAPEN